MRCLLLTPPMVQLNTTYPATPYLTGYLRARGIDVVQDDPALRWVLRLLAPDGLRRLLVAMAESDADHPSVQHVLELGERAISQASAAVSLLQGRDTSLIHRIAARRLFAEGPRFANLGPAGEEDSYLDWAFGSMGVADRARYFATLFLEDLADAITAAIDPHFGFARYGERLAASQPTFEPLMQAAQERPITAVILEELTLELLAHHAPQVVGMSLPFPGSVLGALRMSKAIRAAAPTTRIVWGGGYVNTELRELCDPRVFDWVDAITYDDGERPLECLLEHWSGKRDTTGLLRTRMREGGTVVLHTSPIEHDVPLARAGTPTYDGIPLGDYLGMLDMLNPMHRLWSDTRWNKLTVAHGCYWRKCTFCDVTLDYIGNYQPVDAAVLVDRMEAMIAETGTRGFHLVDEAAPPAGLKALSEEILRRGLTVSFWGNIRFEKAFTPALCELLAKAGCIAVTGGLEVASDRLLKLIDKGVSVAQVARVTQAFQRAGIRVHAYLMYGFPTETEQETVDSLERVRQLFVEGCLDSAYWHRFALTAHAPIAKAPARYGLRLAPEPEVRFARNDLDFEDTSGVDHERFGPGLHKAVYNYMLGLGLEDDVRGWFDFSVPRPKLGKDVIRRALSS